MAETSLSLIAEVRLFLAETGMGPSYFGKKSTGNSEIVKRLESGGRVWPETEGKVREFMASVRNERGACR